MAKINDDSLGIFMMLIAIVLIIVLFIQNNELNDEIKEITSANENEFMMISDIQFKTLVRVAEYYGDIDSVEVDVKMNSIKFYFKHKTDERDLTSF